MRVTPQGGARGKCLKHLAMLQAVC